MVIEEVLLNALCRRRSLSVWRGCLYGNDGRSCAARCVLHSWTLRLRINLCSCYLLRCSYAMFR